MADTIKLDYPAIEALFCRNTQPADKKGGKPDEKKEAPTEVYHSKY